MLKIIPLLAVTVVIFAVLAVLTLKAGGGAKRGVY
jgi:hypothetical protein